MAGMTGTFAIFDKVRNGLDYDQHGHLKVYGNWKAAHRASENKNRAVLPKIRRYRAVELTIRY